LIRIITKIYSRSSQNTKEVCMKLTVQDLELIKKRTSISLFDSLPGDEKKRLLKKWRSERIYTVKDIIPIHNDGDHPLVSGIDY
jgi:hypothetical protein